MKHTRNEYLQAWGLLVVLAACLILGGLVDKMLF